MRLYGCVYAFACVQFQRPCQRVRAYVQCMFTAVTLVGKFRPVSPSGFSEVKPSCVSAGRNNVRFAGVVSCTTYPLTSSIFHRLRRLLLSPMHWPWACKVQTASPTSRRTSAIRYVKKVKMNVSNRSKDPTFRVIAKPLHKVPLKQENATHTVTQLIRCFTVGEPLSFFSFFLLGGSSEFLVERL